MINNKLKKELHKIALDNKVSDTVAEMIVLSPFLFQKRIIEENDLESKNVFYHKFIGKFFLRESVKEAIKRRIEEYGK